MGPGVYLAFGGVGTPFIHESKEVYSDLFSLIPSGKYFSDHVLGNSLCQHFKERNDKRKITSFFSKKNLFGSLKGSRKKSFFF